MESLYKYARIVPLCPFLTSTLIGLSLFFFPEAAKSSRRASAILSTLSLSTSMIFSYNIFWQLINGSSIHQSSWSWILYEDLSLEVGLLIDPLTSIMLVLVTTIGVLVTIYSSSYMFHDRGYVRFFVYLGLFNASMLGLILSPNLIQIYIFWELVGMCSYLLIGFWFARPSAANACQNAFVTNRIGDFGLLLGILGIYWITNSFDIHDLSERFNELIIMNRISPFLANMCAILLFLGPIAKSAQFPLHIWLPDAMEGPTPVSALIHAATMVAAGVFLVARMYLFFEALPLAMNFISWIGAITALLGATIAIAQTDLKKGLAYSTMSQLGYMILALGIGSYRAALFHLITHAFSKALLFLGSGSVIHSMEPIVGYSPKKCQNMILMGGLRAYMPITGITFLLGTFSLCGIPPFACFWSKDEIIADSWSYSFIFGLIAWFTAGLTAFYMFRIYYLTFEGNFRAASENTNTEKIYLSYNLTSSTVLANEKVLNIVPQSRKDNLIPIESFSKIEDSSSYRSSINDFTFPKESKFTMLLPMILLAIPTSLIGFVGSPFFRVEDGYYLLSDWLNSFQNSSVITSSENWLDLVTNSIPSIVVISLGIITSFILYRPLLQSSQEILNPGEIEISNLLPNFINDWSHYRGYIDDFYNLVFIKGTRISAKLLLLVDRWIIDGIVNVIAAFSLFSGRIIRYMGGGRISFYLTGLITGLALLFFLTVYSTSIFEHIV
uniref:NAD(P)H-quinone oxidoreductase subunit 5, chloroplastic n=1 Tax=Mankyua chejuensis TaxID=996148 RepID=H8Y658_9MONI|nr:NADH-plastoquinone oxidoreductase subunit 5 [Mankyua chejuensis]ADZ48026.1 NADH-plastoquinone oxidoreductase subunit 5 [Mankyua chejuensis]AJJ48657.1 NADH dehydrogenase subunit 5 [Mankyua chejuensis]